MIFARIRTSYCIRKTKSYFKNNNEKMAEFVVGLSARKSQLHHNPFEGCGEKSRCAETEKGESKKKVKLSFQSLSEKSEVEAV